MTKKIGYIKTYRSIQDCWIWTCEKFDKAHAWLDLLLDANHQDTKMLIDSKPTVVNRGSLLTSKLKLADKWKWDRKTVTSFLSILEADGMIHMEGFRHGTMITIVNYGLYQQSTDTTTDTTTDTNKNDNNDKNGKKIIEKENIKEKEVFVPPTREQLVAYIEEVKSHIDANDFINYYTANGWKVKGKPMKNWKLSVLSWTTRQKKERPDLYKPKTEKPTIEWE